MSLRKGAEASPGGGSRLRRVVAAVVAAAVVAAAVVAVAVAAVAIQVEPARGSRAN
ncbi:MAG: hypothetical protein WBH47_25075 [Streptosporangiaceae bacterium]